MKKNLQFAVIGLGRFGMTLAQTLSQLGAEVLAVDKDETLIDHAEEFATYAVRLDATDEKALLSLGLENFDTACVCTTDLTSSVLITLICKEAGVKTVISKSQSALHTKVLERVGADRVVFPEADIGEHMARKLVGSNILDFIELSPDYGIAEFTAAPGWINRDLASIGFRNKFGVNVLAIKGENGTINVNPLADDIINEGDIIIALGAECDINKIEAVSGTKKRDAKAPFLKK